MEHKKLKNLRINLIITLLITTCSFVVLDFFNINIIRNDEGKFSKRSCEKGYSYINPRFACGYENKIDKKGYSELKLKLEALIEDKKSQKKAETVAVWFRDLEGGPTFGINEQIDFIPASLLKLPLVMTFFEIAENNPDILEETIMYSDLTHPVLNQEFIPDSKLIKNTAYKIEDLMSYSIAYSDNVSAQLLYEYLIKEGKNDLMLQTYRNLGIIDPGTDIAKVVVNTKEYSSIFRMLYNVSYLDRHGSEKLLSFLGRSTFRNGLRVGVPEHITITHKFGERFSDDGVRELHDCGIIYFPENPYQLCVMTLGWDYNDLSGVIG